MAQLLINNPEKCGMGKMEKCCAYLLAGADGFECGRVTSLKGILKERTLTGQMNARRLPEAPYPECQDQ